MWPAFHSSTRNTDTRICPVDDPVSATSSTQPQTSDPLGWLCQFLATGFSLGSLMPFAPGTLGTAMGIPLTFAMGLLCQQFAQSSSTPAAHAAFLVIVAALTLIGVPICTRGQQRIGRKDPGEVIWDEIASAPLVFFALPFTLLTNPWVLLIGFGLHRLFDISKPPPCKRLEKLPEGWGVMLDDIAAAIYGCVVMHLLNLTGLLKLIVG